MEHVIKSRIVRVGNSRGIRIPRVLLKQLRFGEEVEMAVEPDRLVIRAPHKPREGWDAEFRAMAERGDDRPLDPPVATRFDKEEWEW